MTKAGKHTTKTPSQKHAFPLSSGTLDAPLSPQWAFLVQFRAAPGAPAHDAGRVEHLASGRTSHFQSLQELLTYLLKELRATDQT